MKSKALSKWLMLLAVAVVLIAGVFALAFTINAAESEGKSFAASDHYKMGKGITPNGPITLEAEIYLPDAYHTQRAGAILSNYNNGTYTGAYAFEIMAGGKVRVFSQTHGDVTIDYDITQHMGTDSASEYVKIAVTVNTNTGAIVLYVNGDQKATATNSNSTIDMYNTSQTVNGTTTSNFICIGGDERPNNAQNFKGKIKNIAMYSGIRDYSTATYFDTADENMLFGYDMTKAYDGFLKDMSANGNHANNANWSASEGKTFSEGEDPLYMAKDLEEVPFSYEAIVYAPLGVSRPGPILSNYPNAGGDSISFEIKDGGKPGIYIYDDGEARINYGFNYDIRKNAYVHVAITHETVESNSVFKCYVDGELVDTYTLDYVFSFDLDTINQTGPITLGHCGRVSLYYQGNIKNAALHNRTLTADEVKASYENGVMANEDSLIAYYDLTGSAATADTVSDSSGNGYDLKPLFYEKDFETEDYDYAFAVVGDTQFNVWNDVVNGTTNTKYIYDYIVNNAKSKNIKYVLGLGDIIDNGKYPDGTSSKDAEWAYAYDMITSTLGENNIPYSLVPGNHDFMRPSDTGFQATFGSETTLTKNITGYYSTSEIYNYYMNFEVEGTPYMLLVLEYGANDDILAWANNVIAQNKHRRVIITTHGYMNYDGTTLDGSEYAAPKPNGTTNENYLKYNNGDEMWDEMVRKHPNIIMVLSGHIDYNDIVMREDKGDYGNTVHQFLIDPQAMDKTYSYQTGMVAMFYFRNGGKDVSVEYVSTYRTANNNDKEVLFNPRNQFDFTIEEAPKEESKGEINVWLIGGQSNAAGYAQGLSSEQALDSRYTNGFNNVLYYGYSEKWQSAFTPVKAGLGSNSRSGAELGIAEILGNTGEMNAIIRYAEGASCICPSTTDVDAMKNGTWTSPSYITANGIATDGTKVGLLYNNFINTVESAIAELERMGYTPVIKGMWWMQGEAETYIDNTIGADKYEALLTALIGDVRSNVGAIVGEDLSDMPFVFGRIYRNPNSGTMPYLATVQAAQESVAKNVANTSLVDPADFASLAQHDGWHYDAATQGYLGRSFIEKACEINGDIIVRTSNNYVDFTGGGLYSNKLTDNITVGITADGTMKITGVTKTVGSSAAEAVALTDGKYSFALSGESVTFDVTLDLNDIKTEYGTVPPNLANPEENPIVLFDGSGAVGTYTEFGAAVNAAVTKGADGDYVILLRKNASQSTKGNISSFSGTITVDLGGYTLAHNASYIFDAFYNGGTNPDCSVAVKNGTIVNNTSDLAMFCPNYGGGLSTDVTISFTFDNVIFKANQSSTVVFVTWDNGGNIASKLTTTIVFNDCTFDYTGSPASEVMMSLTNGASVRSIFDVTVNGGKIISDRTINLADIATMDSSDSVKFGKSDNGYTTCELVSGINASTESFTSVNGKSLSFSAGSNNFYTLGEDTVTEYGIIPYRYSNTESYPFAVFRNGRFVGAYSNWALDGGNSALSNAKEAGSVVLFRNDFTNPAGTQYNNLSQTVDVTIDLNGFTFDSRYRAMFFAQKKGTNDTTITVKNGNVLLGSHALISLDTWNPASVDESWGTYLSGNGFNITYDNVNISLINGATTKNVICYNSFASGDPEQFLNVTFNSCVFNLSEVSTELTMFDMSNALCDTTAVINGGKIITSGQTIIFADMTNANVSSSLTFTKADGGAYTTLDIPSGVTLTDITVNNGALTFVKVSDDGSTATYRLTPTAVVGLDFTPKASITLDSNLTFNIYIPEHNGLKSATLNGNAITFGEAKDGYYLVATELVASEAAKELKLVVSLDIDGTSVKGTFTFSLIKYASKLLEAADAAEEEKTLIKDILSYVRSAYVYFNGATSETAEVKAIDELLDGYSKPELDRVEGTSADDNDILEAVTFVLEATPAIRFVLPEGVSGGYTFMIGNEVLEYTTGTVALNGKEYTYCEISLYAYKMIETITYSNGTYSGSYHINSYYDFAVSEGDSALIDIVVKFYNYCKSADVYRDYVLEKQ